MIFLASLVVILWSLQGILANYCSIYYQGQCVPVCISQNIINSPGLCPWGNVCCRGAATYCEAYHNGQCLPYNYPCNGQVVSNNQVALCPYQSYRCCAAGSSGTSSGPTGSGAGGNFPTSNVAGCGKSYFPPSLLNRVIGGKEATKGAYPWQVSLLLNGNHGCGGTLVNSRWIVSAAHCFQQSKNPGSYKVRTGEYDQRVSEGAETDYSVERLIVHPSYSDRSHDYDIAVMKLSRDVDTSSSFVQPACLPTSSDNFEGSSDCWMSGWGATGGSTVNMPHQNKVLRHVGGSALTFSSCANYYGSELHRGMICFGTQTTGGCYGDSGGPMVCRRNNVFTLVGATSWGTPKCNGKPTIFADVVFYLNWINEQISKY